MPVCVTLSPHTADRMNSDVEGAVKVQFLCPLDLV